MYIENIVWRKVIYGQIRRLTLGINPSENSINHKKFKKLKADHALEWGKNNDNPGIWRDFVDNNLIPDRPYFYNIPIDNNRNDLKLWHGDNDNRGNKIKVSQRLWSEDDDIIEIWYLGCMKLLENLLRQFNETDEVTEDSKLLYNFVEERLLELNTYNGELFNWACETMKKFESLTMNIDFLFSDFFKKEKKDYIEKNYFIVISLINDKNKFVNHADMLNLDDENLHDIIRTKINGNFGCAQIKKEV